MTTMDVLVLSDLFPTPAEPYSGIFVLEQVKALRKLGVNVSVICPTPLAPRLLSFLSRVRQCMTVPQRASFDEIAVEYPRVLAPGGRFFPHYGWLFYLSLRKHLASRIKLQRPDVIHAHTVLPGGYAAALLSREYGVPVVTTMHGSDVRDYPRERREVARATRWALRHVSQHIAVSSEIAAQARLLEPATGQIEVIHNGADHSHFHSMDKSEARNRLGIHSSSPVLLFVGSLLPIKGVDVLLRAFSLLLQQRNVKPILYLVGRGDQLGSLEALARQLGASEYVRFVGAQPYATIPAWLSAADCLILPSHGEGLPTIIPEAMLCRVPIVASRVGGIPEIIEDGRSGLLVPPNDPTALAYAISETLSGGAEQIEQRISFAERFAKANLTWDANAKRTSEVYRRVARSQQSANSVAERARVS